ncbi:MAG TPA: MoaD/ThiS family protein [Ktedonobacterales bacterium]|jgi:sulfur carrier protein ThiS
MRVHVATYGDLRRHLLAGAPERAIEVPTNATLGDLLAALGASPDDAILARRAAGIVREDDALADGDQVELFAPVGGG